MPDRIRDRLCLLKQRPYNPLRTPYSEFLDLLVDLALIQVGDGVNRHANQGCKMQVDLSLPNMGRERTAKRFPRSVDVDNLFSADRLVCVLPKKLRSLNPQSSGCDPLDLNKGVSHPSI